MFHERIKHLRKEKGLSQTELGNKLGLSQKQVSHLEVGRNEPDINTICKYCAYFNVSADYLLGMIGDPRPLKE